MATADSYEAAKNNHIFKKLIWAQKWRYAHKLSCLLKQDLVIYQQGLEIAAFSVY